MSPMLDINFIRDHADIVREAAYKKNIQVDIDRLLELDHERRELQGAVDTLRSEQNKAGEEVARAVSTEEKQTLIDQLSDLKEELKAKGQRLKATIEEWQTLMLQVPNIPDVSVPEGAGELNNVPGKRWGEKPSFDFDIQDHVTLMTDLNMVDLERGVKVRGFRGYFLKGDGAELSWALWNYARDFWRERGFESFIAPTVLNKENFYGTGHLPGEADDLFQTQDNQYLSGTAEVAMMGFHRDEILDHKELPKKYLAFSPCYRREAGSHGKDTKGLVRVHEFFKLEQLVLCEASHEESEKFHEEINRSFEEFLESLGIPYQRLNICTGDLGQAKVKQYDTEAWIPSENKYRELSSASYFHDFQTRRFNIKYRDREGNTHFAHSLNNTATATPRLLVALVENFQQADGSIKIPEVLVPYMKKESITQSK